MFEGHLYTLFLWIVCLLGFCPLSQLLRVLYTLEVLISCLWNILQIFSCRLSFVFDFVYDGFRFLPWKNLKIFMYSNEQSFIASAFWVFILKAFSCTKVKEAVTHVSLQYLYSFILFPLHLDPSSMWSLFHTWWEIWFYLFPNGYLRHLLKAPSLPSVIWDVTFNNRLYVLRSVSEHAVPLANLSICVPVPQYCN